MSLKRKPKFVTTGSSKKEKPCCQTLNKQKSEIENYIVQLVEAREDFIKTKWAWGIIKAIEPLSGEKVSKGKKSFLCEKCESYIMPRKRLAELVILGSKG
jgi:hypothetical protein